MTRLLRGIGAILWGGVSIVLKGTVAIALLLGLLAGILKVNADYTATTGGSTTFASLVISAKHYAAMVLCDMTAGESTCATVKAGSGTAAATDTSVVMQINPNSPGLIPAGQTSMSNSAPVAIADDQSVLPVTVTNANPNGQALMANSSPVVFATNQTALPVTGTLSGIGAADPCQNGTHIYIPISQAASAQLQAAGGGSTVNYICAYQWNGADAENISLVEGTTGGTCSGPAALIGGTTAATGNNFAANSGAAGGTGRATLVAGAGTNKAVCLLQSGSGRVAGFLNMVQQ